MKQTYKSFILFLMMAFAITGIFTACSDDDAGGEPRIEYVRVTRPTSSDSLLVAAGQGALVAIMGDNLRDVREIWFNDLRASLNPTYVTNTTIITNVPSQLPTEITNELRLVFANGNVLVHEFEVAINEPVVTRLQNEYARVGSVTTIRGNYFYGPKVSFTGENGPINAEILSVSTDYTQIQVRVPEGAVRGPITVTTDFGEGQSAFWYLDNRNIIASFDGTTAGMWHGPAFIKESDPDFQPINGKFLRMNNARIGDWLEFWVGPADSDVRLETKNIPADAIANPGDYALKFEINTLETLAGSTMNMYIGPDMGGQRGTALAWKPNVDTKGNWETVSIPFADVVEANKDHLVYNPEGYGVSFHFSGSGDVKAMFALDNMRVVPLSVD